MFGGDLSNNMLLISMKFFGKQLQFDRILLNISKSKIFISEKLAAFIF